MPTYVYECPRGHAVEAIRAVAHRDSPIACDTCLREGLDVPARRVPAPPAKIFPGAAQ